MTTAIRESGKRAESPPAQTAPPALTAPPPTRRPSFRQVNVRLSAEVFAELEQAAQLDHRTLSSAIAVAVARWARSVRDQGEER